MEEGPGLAVLAAGKDVAEQLLRLAAIEEMLLVGGALIGIAGGDGDPLDAERADLVEEGRDPFRLRIVEQSAVDGDAEALGFGELQGRHGAIEDALLADRFVMRLPVAIEMDRPVEIAVGLEPVDLLLEQQRIGADGDVFAACDGALNDFGQFLVQQRLAAGDDEDRRAAFVERFQALIDRNAEIEDLVRIIDLAAAGASKIAAIKRLQHQHEREALAPHQLLLGDIGADLRHLQDGNTHLSWTPIAM